MEQVLSMPAINQAKIRIYGHTGFIGTHLVNYFIEQGCLFKNLELYGGETDLLNRKPPSKTLADYTFNLTGINGGLTTNLSKGAELFTENAFLTLNLLRHEVNFSRKILNTIPSCAYPSTPNLIREQDLWNGPCHASVLGHGVSKRLLDTFAKLCSTKTCSVINITPTTVYGAPNHLSLERTKVLESLIIKFIRAKRDKTPSVTLMGTGDSFREFIYVKDLMPLMVKAMTDYYDVLPLNITSAQEFRLEVLADLIKKEVGYEGRIEWDGNEQGEFRKGLSIARQTAYLGGFPFTPFETGLKETVMWYQEQLS